MVSMDYALRHYGIPSLSLWDVVLRRQAVMKIHEDNQAMIRVMETGRNPTMKYLHRTHRVSVAWLHEIYESEQVEVEYELSSKMRAGMYTKASTDPAKWKTKKRLLVNRILWTPRTLRASSIPKANLPIRLPSRDQMQQVMKGIKMVLESGQESTMGQENLERPLPDMALTGSMLLDE